MTIPVSSGPAEIAAATPLQRVRGTNDYLPPEEARLRGLDQTLRVGFERYGYEGVQTPILEPLELFLRKSGDEIVARMYAFSHWNRQLCLRPEITASVMRAYVNELQGRTLPVRLHYGGATFRYEKPQRGRYRQFTEVGLELIGAAGAAGDAEVLRLACEGLDTVGVRGYRLVVGHLGVVLEMLRGLGMSEHAQGLILDLMEPIARGRISPDAAVARVVELLGGRSTNGHAPEIESLPEALAGLPPEQALAVAADILRRARLPLEGGVRRPQQIVQRLLAKASRPDPTEQVRAAVDFVGRLHEASAPAGNLHPLRDLVREAGLSTGPLDELEGSLDYLRAYGPPADGVAWEVDLSLARGLRYYTGLVFEVYVDTPDGPLQVCGGGRYDDLIRALGGRESVPACGFSFGLERVDLVRPADVGHDTRRRLVVAGVAEQDHTVALALAAELRTAIPELTVEQDVRLRGPKATLRYADRSGAWAVAMVGEREREEGVALVRLLVSREERRVPLAEVAATVRGLLPA